MTRTVGLVAPRAHANLSDLGDECHSEFSFHSVSLVAVACVFRSLLECYSRHAIAWAFAIFAISFAVGYSTLAL